MRDGEKVREFDSADVPVRTIVEAMVGRSMEQMFPPLATPAEETVLEVERPDLARRRFRDVSFTVRKGEIFGIAGLVGAGEPSSCAPSPAPIRSGPAHPALGQRHHAVVAARDAIRNGIVLVPEDRKQQGVILDHSIAENIAYSNFDSVGRRAGSSPPRARLRRSEHQPLRREGQGRQKASEMSGGNQQKVVIAKWLARNPRVVLLDEPTRGSTWARGRRSTKSSTHSQETGVAVIVVSSDLEEVLGVSNRILVMAAGRQTGILDHAKANDVSVMELATA
jgi:ribose transport system ATP-binding protein